MRKTGKFSAHMQAVYGAAKEALEMLTESTLDECGDNPNKRLHSKFAMEEHFDMLDESQLVQSAFRICALSDDIRGRSERVQHANFALGEPDKDEDEPVIREFSHSTSSMLRQLDLEITKFKGAQKACLRQTRECKEDAVGKERKQLKEFFEALQEIKGHIETIDEHMAGMQEGLNFRKR
jgi:DNA-binding FrmR family transcriptional regulator